MENSNENNIKELAKDLCEKSSCHHKCHDTKDCVVEDEALLLINENKSNNFDVKSNNEIEEMAFNICGLGLFCFECNNRGKCKAKKYAERAYNAGYRKQSEGEWETIPDYQPNKLITYRHICSVCKTFYKDIRSHGHTYCHECGSKMKGGE